MFKKAERKKTKLKLALTGPSGSGKTFSALILAKTIGQKIAVIDTENGSASLYSDMKEGPLVGLEFDVMDMMPPFTTEKYIEAINAAEKAGYDTIVIDSLTHAWAGEGGLLQQKAQLDARPNSNHWTNWGPIDKKDLELKNAYLHSSCHVICTMRSKMDYAQVENNGKKKVEKLGMAPIQRDGLEYEFTTVFDLTSNNEADVSKDRTTLFKGKFFKITEETGKELLNWLNTGADYVPPPKPEAKPTAKGKTFVPYTGDPAEFIATLGTNKGKMLKDIPVETLDSSLDWMEKNIKNPNQEQQEYYKQTETYLIKIGFYPPRDSLENQNLN